MIRWLRDMASGAMRVTGETPAFDREFRRVMRNAFSGGDGVKALTYILVDLGFYDRLEKPDGSPLVGDELIRAAARQDYARRLLEILGPLHEGNAERISEMFMDLPVWEKKQRSQEDT